MKGTTFFIILEGFSYKNKIFRIDDQENNTESFTSFISKIRTFIYFGYFLFCEFKSWVKIFFQNRILINAKEGKMRPHVRTYF